MMTTRSRLICLLIVTAAATASAEPAPSSLGLEQGIEFFEAGNLAASRPHLEHALAEQPENHVALCYLGRLELQEEHLDVAIERLKRAVELNREDSMYRTWLGRAYIAKLQTVSFFAKGTIAGRALEQLEKAVQLDPTNVEARISLAGYYSNAPSIAGGSKKKARQQLEHIMQYEPIRGKAIMANVLIKEEKYDEAAAMLEECIAAEPTELSHRYRLGMLYQRLESYDEAFATFEDILQTEPRDPGALYQLGRTAVFSGSNIERAIACLKTYLALPVEPGYPSHAAAHWRLGLLFEHQNDSVEAKKHYENALLLDPDEEKYRDALNALEVAKH